MSTNPQLDEAMRRALEPAWDRLRCGMTEWVEFTLPALRERITAEIERLREVGQ